MYKRVFVGARDHRLVRLRQAILYFDVLQEEVNIVRRHLAQTDHVMSWLVENDEIIQFTLTQKT